MYIAVPGITLRRFFIYLSGAAQRQKKLSVFALDRRRDNNMYADTRALLYICGVIVLPLSFCYICPVILNTDRRYPSRKERGTEVSIESQSSYSLKSTIEKEKQKTT